MEVNNIIKELKTLQELLISKQSKEESLKEIRKELHLNYDIKFNTLGTFDNNNKKNYILSKIGKAPEYIKPKLFLPNLVKKAKEEHQTKVKKYNEDYRKAEIEYYNEFNEIRNKLKNEDENNKKACINKIEANYNKVEKEIKLIINLIEKTTIISKAYWDINSVSKILAYFENKRVETIKEAVNMFHEEKRFEEEKETAQKHREKIENMIADLRKDIDEINERIDSELVDFQFKLSSFELKINEVYDKVNEVSWNIHNEY